MATPAEHQYAAILALLPAVVATRQACDLYLSRLGDDRGVRARIVRRSHYGVIAEPAAVLAAAIQANEPAIFDPGVRARLVDREPLARIAHLEHLPEQDHDGWDRTVVEIRDGISHLEEVLRSALAVARGETATRIPGYELVELIGQGGFGTVYKARDRSGVERAVKLLTPSPFGMADGADARFEREAKLLASVDHPNVVKYVLMDRHGDTWYLVMELIRGRGLAEWAREQPAAARVAAVAQVLDGVAALHAAGVIHRDLKPSNVVIDETTGRPVIVDLGMSWAVRGGDQTLTHGSAWSTGYAPPEVIADPAQSRTPGHDLYSVGVVLYEVLAGRRPPAVGRVPLSHHDPQFAAYDDVVARALAVPDLRFASAEEFSRALHRAREGARSPWSLVFSELEQIRSPVLRELLDAAVAAGERGDATSVAIVTAGFYRGLRIRFTRAFRLARGSDAHKHEAFLPLRGHGAAIALFRHQRALSWEVVLAKDKHGDAALQRLGFGLADLAAIQVAEDFALQQLGAARDPARDPDGPPPVSQQVQGVRALVRVVLELERNELAFVEDFAALAASALAPPIEDSPEEEDDG
ncbi:MAG: serine/threonine protein kinase [Kofleriaceae bacterium]|nr:serine/threonine protein kinase [Kofleriaceae bacterium]MBP9166852.1 serine/threonine protein kinase [Kofleriaceae bacterium]MBP9859983.1 serine/threonine protein kinase [Kofleriaceae bacterium]